MDGRHTDAMAVALQALPNCGGTDRVDWCGGGGLEGVWGYCEGRGVGGLRGGRLEMVGDVAVDLVCCSGCGPEFCLYWSHGDG